MAKLKEDFPGFAQLDAAGEATTAKVRKRIKDGTLREIDGIGEAREQEIIKAFQDIDTPAEAAADLKETEDDESITPASQAKEAAERGERAQQPGEAETGSVKADDFDPGSVDEDRAAVTEGSKGATTASGPILSNTETVDADRGAETGEAEKSGTEKNQLPGHDLAPLTPREREEAGVAQSDAERVANSGAVFVHDPAGEYASRTGVHIPQAAVRIKVEPIAHVPPRRGVMVKDGEDVYAVQETFPPDAQGTDWLRVRSPNTGLPLIR